MNGQQVYKLYVKYFSREFLPAEPPFTIVSSKSEVLRPDTIFTIDINNEKSNLMTLTKPGIYHFQADTSKKEGFTLFHFYEDFPLITNAEQMLYPLKYITTKNEFNDLLMMKNIKSTIDAFWLEKAGNAERAREMIKVYYNRVQDANRFFTSYTEGWKTDRGIIYVVFGPPYSVYRSPFNETWNYGEDRNIFSMTMDFNKTDNPYTDNDYTLSRSPEYKDVWYSAVESWRR
jgi:GWxTD domain-containing protein